MEFKLTRPIVERSIASREKKGITRTRIISDVLDRFDDQLIRDLEGVKDGKTFMHILQEASLKPGEDGYDARSGAIAREVNSLLEDFLNYKFRIPLPDNPDFTTDEVRQNLVLSHHKILTDQLCSESQATALMSAVLYSADMSINEVMGRETHTNMSFKARREAGPGNISR